MASPLFATSLFIFTFCILHRASSQTSGGILYPRESTTRERKDLSGVWNFRISPKNGTYDGFNEQWYLRPLRESGEVIPMAVPSSYNDITQDHNIRDFIGWAWYDLEFFVPSRWKNNQTNVHLRFGSVNYNAEVWLNGVSVMNHSGGHLPFEADVTDVLKFSAINRITVAVNNTLTPDTIPQGSINYRTDPNKYPPGYFDQTLNFDFFNYAGIHRPVFLHTTPKLYVDDITVITDISADHTEGYITYNISYKDTSVTPKDAPICYVSVYDKNNKFVVQVKGLTGTLAINGSSLHLWWPYLMNPEAGYLYTLEVHLTSPTGDDYYYLPVGIRTVKWSNSSFLINDEPFYFRGFGKHEDADIRGRGVDVPIILKDFNLIKWLGANSFRTSHYPYAEEIMDEADRQGIVIIDEAPAVGLNKFGTVLLQTHLTIMEELVRRDKNRPSVVMWSVGNEPTSDKAGAGDYFRQVVERTQSLDQTRAVTLVLSAGYSSDQAAQYLDIICINRYFAWYSDTGHLELIQLQMVNEVKNWRQKFGKPVIVTEYGADTISGLHMDPSYVFTEDYQTQFMMEYFQAFNTLRQQGNLIGEMIWNFADFLTPQGTTRVVGNKKGILTRERQPKASAHTLRDRYWQLAIELKEGVYDIKNAPRILMCPLKEENLLL